MPSCAEASGNQSAGKKRGPDFSVIVPTFNERENVAELARRIDIVLSNVSYEIIYVDDDSRDGTLQVLREMAESDARIRLVHRIGRRGLSSAVVEGIQSSAAPCFAVIDADLQHDETLLSAMFEAISADKADLVVGSRYVSGGGVGDWSKSRQLVSRFATWMSGLVLKAHLGDPMSGYFAMNRSTFDEAARRLSQQGYKILLDVVASLPTAPRVLELPYVFSARVHGESKLDSAVTWEYLLLLADKLVGHIVPVRFLMFIAVGGAGVFVHMAVLAFLFRGIGQAFIEAQTIAMIAAMTFNYFVNNFLTYRDRRQKGWKIVYGLISFYAVCSFGAIANVGIANFAFGYEYSWWLAGLAGILVGAVWNYAASSVVTWGAK
ncbi:MAG: Dolichyl-phosphate beta-D-mannosyltransferase [Hyphomicrobiales bacterium]|nr:Dolichyl-phosphate beta-D-mannosyltransferase [Hyphomicrobiales bacterium]